MTDSITITKLSTPIREGDWHDKPLRWLVSGPAQEMQNFSTKRNATRYRTLRRKAGTITEAINAYVRES